jgi:hypothetical protein
MQELEIHKPFLKIKQRLVKLISGLKLNSGRKKKGKRTRSRGFRSEAPGKIPLNDVLVSIGAWRQILT